MKIFLKIFILALLVALLGCAGAKAKRSTADAAYKEAADLFDRKRYEEAATAFQELSAKYPLSKYAVPAKLKIADSYFYAENYPEAISAYRNFEKLHPTNENIPYTLFQIGMSYFNQVLTIDRDQTATMNAATEFSRLIPRFPDSKYTEKAKENLATSRNNLAENEFYIGDFYYRKGNFKAAAERFEALIRAYPEFKAMDKVFFFLGKAYMEAGEKDKGKANLKKLLEGYPDSEFAGDARGIVTAE